ncbi:MAG TPA: lysophospholipid acyltransferase family protein, partial [Acidobacteriota bacterium]|nr:lysophospholipid acyltransferase family protein [Acidobacteriota bacterium]
MSTRSAVEFWRALAHLVVLRPLVKLLYGVRVTGGGHLRHLDHYIIIANHNSHLDILLLFYLLPLGHIARTHAVAEEEYFSRSRIVFRLVRFLFQPLWVRRGEASTQHDPLQEIRRRLDAGHNIIVFPEGTRGKPGALEHFKSGIGRLIAEYPGIPVVPVFLVGPERALPKSRALLLPFLCSVRVGPPRTWSGPHRDITRGLEDQFTFLAHVATSR